MPTIERVALDIGDADYTALIYDVFLCKFSGSRFVTELFRLPPVLESSVLDGQYACVIAPYYSRRQMHNLRLVLGGKRSGEGFLIHCPYSCTCAMLFAVPDIVPPVNARLVCVGNNPPDWESDDFVLQYRGLGNRGFLSVATKVRYDRPYINEWIEYHASLGVEHFYIYTHDSASQFADVLQPRVASGQVTHLTWDYPHVGHPPRWYPFWPHDSVHYSKPPFQVHSVRAFGHLWDWMIHIDCDEFLVHPVDSSLAEILKPLSSDVQCVEVSGKWFGSGSRPDIPDNIVETFTQCEEGHTCRFKCIFRPEHVQSSLIHWCATEKDPLVIDPKVLRFNHYRSISDYHQRRGPAFDNEFGLYNGCEDISAIELMRAL